MQPSAPPSFLHNLTRLFATHRVAANLLMFLMILAGLLGLRKINTQFFPTFELDLITIQVPWRGATAEDVQRAITIPIEQELKSLNNIKKIQSDSRQGMALIRIEVEEGADLGFVLDEVKQQVNGIRNLPTEAEEPVIQQITRYEPIANLLLTGPGSLDELRPLARQLERELLARGIRKVDFNGLPEEEIAIQVPSERLHELGLSLNELGQIVRLRSQDLPAGLAGRKDGTVQVRSLNQQRTPEGFAHLPVVADDSGKLVRLGDIAHIERRARDNEPFLTVDGQPAIELVLLRTENDDTLSMARIMNDWLAQTRPTLPPDVELRVYYESWQFLRDRIELLLRNGAGGLLLVIATLFLFLNVRVAWWVTVGIPVSFLATLAVVYLIGGSINMISLFGLIMALGIIVDDAIVVGEDTLTHVQQGEPASQAAIGGAHRMLAPVISSSLTTVAAFLPLMLVGGTIGNILIDIPTIVICVIIASLVECFLILPGHLTHSFRRARSQQPGKLRIWLDQRFYHFRDHRFRRLVRAAVRHRWTTVACACALLILALGLVAGGRVKFTFFPTVDGSIINANVQFTAGSDAAAVDRFLAHLDATVKQTNEEFGGELVHSVISIHRRAAFRSGDSGSNAGDEYGQLVVSLFSSETRPITNAEFIARWRAKVQLPPGIEKFAITQQQPGPPGKPIEIKLSGEDVGLLKQLSLQIQEALRGYSGVSNVDDDLPFGKQQMIFELTPTGEAIGLNLDSVGRQLRAALDGQLVQIFHAEDQEIEVRMVLPDEERNYLSTLEQLPVILPGGETAPLSNVVSFSARRGIDVLRRVNGELSVIVSADVDENVTNANEILGDLRRDLLADIEATYPVRIGYEGRSADQGETLADMRIGLFMALALIYLILAWVFASYSWPFAVMAAIPFGLTGAVFGHFLLGMDLTILSLFGLFGLSGIVINDSIVLITFYQKLRAQGLAILEAIEEAACQRLRAVLLTSLTTIAGLTPILFETSVQARFLIPMATAIVFGLAFGTLLILLVVPSLLVMIEHLRERRQHATAAEEAIEISEPEPRPEPVSLG